MQLTPDRLVTLLLAALVVGAVAACSPAQPSPTPAPQATPLQIATASPAQPLPPGAAWGCQQALAAPVRVAHADGAMVFEALDGSGPRALVWPRGFSAWLVDGQAQLRARDGSLVAREGDVLDNLGGGMGPAGDAFHVCSIGDTMFPPVP